MSDTPTSRFDDAANAELDILFVGDFDEEASPLRKKGLGELTAVSVAPAIANAVYHAIGKRIRDLPITTEKLLWRVYADGRHCNVVSPALTRRFVVCTIKKGVK